MIQPHTNRTYLLIKICFVIKIMIASFVGREKVDQEI